MNAPDVTELDRPLAREIAYGDPVAAFSTFSGESGAVFLDSALTSERLGRYSFIAAEPFRIVESRDRQIRLDGRVFDGNPFDVLKRELELYQFDTDLELPPFQGGVAGYFGYDLGRHLERVPPTEIDDLPFPDLALGFYDVVVAYDHQEERAWIVSSGLPEREPVARRARARARAEAFEAKLSAAPALVPVPAAPARPPAVASNFGRATYEAAVQRVIDYIHAGDIFQANLAQRFRADLPADLSPFELYRRLRDLNPAPFAAFLRFGDSVLASSSPERFLQVREGRVETRPIKGTLPRGRDPLTDAAFAARLRASEKDRAENVMIVDLLRNDLSRVCEDESVQVPELCALESFATVFHLVSTITGRLRPDKTAVDLLEAAFPGGSITGAPKIRAMEIIAELEPTRRGPYCGSVGYIGFDGTMDSNIVIRTFAIHRDSVTFQAGGGIVADSDPVAEYGETLAKARALMAALSPDAHIDDSGRR